MADQERPDSDRLPAQTPPRQDVDAGKTPTEHDDPYSSPIVSPTPDNLNVGEPDSRGHNPHPYYEQFARRRPRIQPETEAEEQQQPPVQDARSVIDDIGPVRRRLTLRGSEDIPDGTQFSRYIGSPTTSRVLSRYTADTEDVDRDGERGLQDINKARNLRENYKTNSSSSREDETDGNVEHQSSQQQQQPQQQQPRTKLGGGKGRKDRKVSFADEVQISSSRKPSLRFSSSSTAPRTDSLASDVTLPELPVNEEGVEGQSATELEEERREGTHSTPEDLLNYITWAEVVQQIMEDFRRTDIDEDSSTLRVFSRHTITHAIEEALRGLVAETTQGDLSLNVEQIANEWYRGRFHGDVSETLHFRVKGILKRAADAELLGNRWTEFQLDLLKYLSTFTPQLPSDVKFDVQEIEEYGLLKDHDQERFNTVSDWLDKTLEVDRRPNVFARLASHPRVSGTNSEQGFLDQSEWYVISPTSSTDRILVQSDDDRDSLFTASLDQDDIAAASQVHSKPTRSTTTGACSSDSSGSASPNPPLATAAEVQDHLIRLAADQEAAADQQTAERARDKSQRAKKTVRFDLTEEQLQDEAGRYEEETGLDLTEEERNALRKRARSRTLSREDSKREKSYNPYARTARRPRFASRVTLLEQVRRLPKRWPTMSRVHDQPPPRHLTLEMLEDCSKEQGPKGEEALIVLEDGFDFDQVKVLRVEYKNVQTIDNLWRLTQLTRLTLSNNVIEAMEGFDALVHLEILDLSFNNIKVIQGLEKNTKLTEMALAHNMIIQPDNLLHLSKLEVLTFSHNCINDPEHLLYFRRIKSLRSLTVDHNPCGEEPNIAALCISHIPQLIYLNFRFITTDMRNEAEAENRSSLSAVEEFERGEKRVAAKKAKDEANQKLLTDAYVDGLTEDDFFELIFSKDSVSENMIHEVEIVGQGKANLKKVLFATTETMVKSALEERKKRDNALEMFLKCMNGAIQDNVSFGRKECDSFDESKDKFQDDDGTADVATQTEMAKTLSGKIAHLESDLLTAEIRLSDQIDDVMKEFERYYNERVVACVEAMQRGFSSCRDHLKEYYEKAQTDLGHFIDSAYDENPPGALSEELKNLLNDKQGLLSQMATSHDNHLLLIDNKEDKLLSCLRGDAKDLLKKLQDEEIERNLRRVSEVRGYITSVRDNLSDYDDDDDDDEVDMTNTEIIENGTVPNEERFEP
ncbi:uncharacterized protein LOC135812330 isoform X2 [Sycon ciliatum]|uniref:uncharacterized protein LOC135812330 isoform X2 n=1 Tax=Sycon ciliatum TaxID=27933 RepID=UPI0031F6AB59